MTTTFDTATASNDSSEDALKLAVSVLMRNGFRIVELDASSASLTGPGLNSTRQNPLLGATSIQLQADSRQLVAHAELGGVDRMRKFLFTFPPLLGMGLGLLMGIIGGLTFGKQFGIGFGVPFAQGWWWMVTAMVMCLLPVSPWLVLSPIMSNMIRKRTECAIESLIHNAQMMTKTV